VCVCVFKGKMTNLIDKISKLASVFEKKAQEISTVELIGPFEGVEKGDSLGPNTEVFEFGYRLPCFKIKSDAFWNEAPDYYNDDDDDDDDDGCRHLVSILPIWSALGWGEVDYTLRGFGSHTNKMKDYAKSKGETWPLVDFDVYSINNVKLKNQEDSKKIKAIIKDKVFQVMNDVGEGWDAYKSYLRRQQ
jgi:hypothetical protein